MSKDLVAEEILDKGTLSFTIESRILRELGERLVKQPEVALLELIKNAYDADAKVCEINIELSDQIQVLDDGHGMTLEEFKNGWMRIGTNSKENLPSSRKFGRAITGEKGIGRFAVRFLGKQLELQSVAFDKARQMKTKLTAKFDWPAFDHNEDLGKVQVPYNLVRVESNLPTGTQLTISKRRQSAKNIDLSTIRTASISVVTPYQSLLRPEKVEQKVPKSTHQDPGFLLKLLPSIDQSDDGDVALSVLNSFVLRATTELKDDKLRLKIYRRGANNPVLEIVDRYPNSIGPVYADIRFFPQRSGTFINLPVDGRRAKTWVKDHSGVAVFDRTFRVHPYGLESDDWLNLAADTAKRSREPRSSISKKHFPMDEATRLSTQLNYMLRLPYSQQLVGVVQVAGRRSSEQFDDDDGLIAAADREGFVNNGAFSQLCDLIRGSIEAIASADRELQQELEKNEREELLLLLKRETQEAIEEIEANPRIGRGEKNRIIKRLAQTQLLAEEHEEHSRQRESTLEIMSLLGVVAGYMTHEFGTALDELEQVQQKLIKLGRKDNTFKEAANSLSEHMTNLRDFVTYSQGYIQGANTRPNKPFPARPRIQQVVRFFGKYAEARDIAIEINVERDVAAPLVPVSLYNGIALNLYSNALKAVASQQDDGDRKIAFRAWNQQRWHHLEVSDTGIGIPTAMRKRVFEPLFTTTDSNRDPLGSGMGLGLSLVKRGVESYGGRIDVIDPPPGFTTCVRIRMPITED